MSNLKITCSYLNEHTNELVLYVGSAIYCTITNVQEFEIEDIISDIEYEHNRNNSKSWCEFLAK